MNLEGILSITGKPGLFKMISQAKNTIVVESLIDKKRMPLYASHQVSALEDIGIYTYSDTVPLSEIFDAIAVIENGGACINHNSCLLYTSPSPRDQEASRMPSSA